MPPLRKKQDLQKAENKSAQLAPGTYLRTDQTKPSEVAKWGKTRDPKERGSNVVGYENAQSVWVDVSAEIYSFDGNVYDVTDDIISGSISRNTNAPSTLTITIANEGDKYRQRMIPNDRIVVKTRRNNLTTTAFTGYITSTPMFNLVDSREITLECACIIRRFSQKFWDSNLPENILALSSPFSPDSPISNFGGNVGDKKKADRVAKDTGQAAKGADKLQADAAKLQNNLPKKGKSSSPSISSGSIPLGNPVTPQSPDPNPNTNPNPGTTDQSGKPIPGSDLGAGGMITPDMTLAFLMVAPDHIGLNPDYVLIQKFPDEWTKRAEEINQKNEACSYGWSNYIVCPGPGGNCSETAPAGGGGGGQGSKTPISSSGLTIGDVVNQNFDSAQREIAAAIIFLESGGDAVAVNNWDSNAALGTRSVGIFQIIEPTAQGVDPSATFDKLKDPMYSAHIASLIQKQQGWSPWSTYSHWKDGVGHEKTKITNYTPAPSQGQADKQNSIKNPSGGGGGASPGLPSNMTPRKDTNSGSSQNNFDQVVAKGKSLAGPGYYYGGGHNGETIDQAKSSGVDCCLIGETMVLGPNGINRIDSLSPGDIVYSHEEGKLTENKVKAAWFSKEQEVFELRTNNRKIETSANHPFLLKENEWSRLDKLKVGDKIVGLDENSFIFEEIHSIKSKGVKKTYDIEVENSHNFIADGLVVHNSGLFDVVFDDLKIKRPSGYAGTPAWYDFVSGTTGAGKYDPSKKYPPGTFLVNNNLTASNDDSHMGMIYDDAQHVLEGVHGNGVQFNLTAAESHKYNNYEIQGSSPSLGTSKSPGTGDTGTTGNPSGFDNKGQPCGSGKGGDKSLPGGGGGGDNKGNISKDASFGIDGGFILSPYGAKSPWNDGIHHGVDITAGQGKEGAAIRALGNGTVESAGSVDNGCGTATLVIKYDNGPMTLYCHDQDVSVKQGDKVSKGDIIGHLGCQGNCAISSPDWPHVHLATSNTNDPMTVFDLVSNIDPAIALGIDKRGTQAMFQDQEKKDPNLSPNTAGHLDQDGILRDAITRHGAVDPISFPNDGRDKSPYYFINQGKNFVGAPFRWGGGHDERLTIEQAKIYGVDTSGLFNLIRYNLGLENWDIGGTPDYYNFLQDLRPFTPGRDYDPGTILINIGGGDVIGHMAMVIDRNQHVLEANGGKGRVYDEYTVEESDQDWQGYTHVGHMPDIGTIRIIQSPYVNHKDLGRQVGAASVQAVSSGSTDLSSYPSTYSISGYNFTGFRAQVAHLMADKFGIQPNTYAGHSGDQGNKHTAASLETNSIDWFQPPTYVIGRNNKDSKALNDAAEYMHNNHGPLGIVFVIWQGQQDWAGGGWQPYTQGTGITEGHYDHPHISFADAPSGAAIPPGGSKGTSPGGKDTGTGPGTGTDTGGTGPGGVSSGSDEPCITRHPLGVYKLAMQAVQEMSSTDGLMSIAKRSMALNNGSMSAVKDAVSHYFPENEYEKFPELFQECQEDRHWIHFAEAFKESYMPTIQAVKDSGMYTMMSLGTGEVVFWYPELTYLLSEDHLKMPANQQQEDHMRKGLVTAPDEKNIYSQYPETRGHGLKGEKISDIVQIWPEIAPYFSKVKTDIASKKDISGISLNDTNAQILSSPIELEEIDLVDFSIYVSDEMVTTHYYIQGSYMPFDSASTGSFPFLKCYRWSTIFDHPLFYDQYNTGVNFDPASFIQKYGVRSKTESVPYIKTIGMAQLWAESKLLRDWLNCYTIKLETSYLPEAYPGMKIQVKSLGVECMIIQANHSFGSSWNTQLVVSMPINVTDESKVPPLPFWSLIDRSSLNKALDPNNPVTRSTASFEVGNLGTSGDLFDQINEKRNQDNEHVKNWLDQWTQRRNDPKLMEKLKEELKKHPRDTVMDHPPADTLSKKDLAKYYGDYKPNQGV